MKQLFTIACTLVLGGALAFAQTGSTTGGQTPAGGDQTSKTSTSTTTKKHHHHGAKKSKKTKKSATDSDSGASSKPIPQINCVSIVTQGGLSVGRFFLALQESFPFSSFSA